MIRTWIVGYDFSTCSDAAAEAAATELDKLGGRLLVVHAYRQPDKHVGFDLAQSSPALKPLDDLGRMLADAIGTRLEAVVQRLRERHPTLIAEPVVAEGHPATVIIAVAAEHSAERIVVGTHGHSGIRKFFLGSVAERVLRLSTLPVLVIKHDGEGESASSSVR